MTYNNRTATKLVTIPSGTSLSSSFDLEASDDTANRRLFGIDMPATWTAASVSFQASFDGGTTWDDVYDTSGVELVMPAGTSRYIALDPVIFAAIPMIKVRSGTSAVAVNQGGDRVLKLVLRSV